MLYQYGKDEIDDKNLQRLLSSPQQMSQPIVAGVHVFILEVAANEVALLDAVILVATTEAHLGDRNVLVYWDREGAGYPIHVHASGPQPPSTTFLYDFVLDGGDHFYANYNSVDTRLPFLPIFGRSSVYGFLDASWGTDAFNEAFCYFRRLNIV